MLRSLGTFTIRPHLAPSDFHLFGPLKNNLFGRHFANDDAVIQEVTLWLRQRPKDFFPPAFKDLSSDEISVMPVA